MPPSEARAFCDWLNTPAAPSLTSACSAAGKATLLLLNSSSSLSRACNTTPVIFCMLLHAAGHASVRLCSNGRPWCSHASHAAAPSHGSPCLLMRGLVDRASQHVQGTKDRGRSHMQCWRLGTNPTSTSAHAARWWMLVWRP